MGDLVKMCPDEFGPPPYMVALIEPNQVMAMGHKEAGEWVNLSQFVLRPQADGTTRLVLCSRSMMRGRIWSLIDPGVFIMECSMLLGIKERAEALGRDRKAAVAGFQMEPFYARWGIKDKAQLERDCLCHESIYSHCSYFSACCYLPAD